MGFKMKNDGKKDGRKQKGQKKQNNNNELNAIKRNNRIRNMDQNQKNTRLLILVRFIR